MGVRNGEVGGEPTSSVSGRQLLSDARSKKVHRGEYLHMYLEPKDGRRSTAITSNGKLKRRPKYFGGFVCQSFDGEGEQEGEER